MIRFYLFVIQGVFFYIWCSLCIYISNFLPILIVCQRVNPIANFISIVFKKNVWSPLYYDFSISLLSCNKWQFSLNTLNFLLNYNSGGDLVKTQGLHRCFRTMPSYKWKERCLTTEACKVWYASVNIQTWFWRLAVSEVRENRKRCINSIKTSKCSFTSCSFKRH